MIAMGRSIARMQTVRPIPTVLQGVRRSNGCRRRHPATWLYIVLWFFGSVFIGSIWWLFGGDHAIGVQKARKIASLGGRVPARGRTAMRGRRRLLSGGSDIRMSCAELTRG